MTRFPRRMLAWLALGALAAIALPHETRAQDAWPNRSIRLVIPYPPGGTTDIVGRYLAERLTRELGQTVVVDNRPGGGTNIGAEAVVTARPDGYTILFAGITQVTNPVFGPVPSFDTLKAFEPVGLIASAPFMLAANTKVTVTDARDILARARSAPDKLSVSSAQLDIFVELLNARAGMKLLHVPYKGGAPAAADAIGGQVDMVFAQIPALMTHLQSGRLRAMAVSSAKRFPALPDMPTWTELGVDYVVDPWFGLLAPAGTPKPIVDRLSVTMEKIIASPEFVQRIRGVGAEPGFGSPQAMAETLRRDIAFWQGVAKTLPHLVTK